MASMLGSAPSGGGTVSARRARPAFSFTGQSYDSPGYQNRTAGTATKRSPFTGSGYESGGGVLSSLINKNENRSIYAGGSHESAIATPMGQLARTVAAVTQAATAPAAAAAAAAAPATPAAPAAAEQPAQSTPVAEVGTLGLAGSGKGGPRRRGRMETLLTDIGSAVERFGD